MTQPAFVLPLLTCYCMSIAAGVKLASQVISSQFALHHAIALMSLCRCASQHSVAHAGTRVSPMGHQWTPVLPAPTMPAQGEPRLHGPLALGFPASMHSSALVESHLVFVAARW